MRINCKLEHVMKYSILFAGIYSDGIMVRQSNVKRPQQEYDKFDELKLGGFTP
jgi:hypothetical protein